MLAMSGSLIVVGAVESVHREHGHAPGSGSASEVVKDHEWAGEIGLPAASAAVTEAVYVVPAPSGLVGVNVAVRVAESYEAAPPLTEPFEVLSEKPSDEGTMSSLKVAVGVLVTGWLVAPATGAVLDTTGAVVSGGVPVRKVGSTQ